jgi:hypothetical protein
MPADCNHSSNDHAAHSHHGHAAPGASQWRLAAHSTLHCLTGCVIGETIGLAIGVELGLATGAIITLATALSYVSGFTLGLVPVMRERGISLIAALKIIWIGEATSIAVMEIAMNAADYAMGGMGVKTMFSWIWLRSLLVAVPVGFLAAWPVNYWLLKRDLKKCH